MSNPFDEAIFASMFPQSGTKVLLRSLFNLFAVPSAVHVIGLVLDALEAVGVDAAATSEVLAASDAVDVDGAATFALTPGATKATASDPSSSAFRRGRDACNLRTCVPVEEDDERRRRCRRRLPPFS